MPFVILSEPNNINGDFAWLILTFMTTQFKK